jgi:enoyl-CoA hydratase/carnithine racemase
MVGLHKAREMLFLGNRYDAAELADIGVAWRVVSGECSYTKER